MSLNKRMQCGRACQASLRHLVFLPQGHGRGDAAGGGAAQRAGAEEILPDRSARRRGAGPARDPEAPPHPTRMRRRRMPERAQTTPPEVAADPDPPTEPRLPAPHTVACVLSGGREPTSSLAQRPACEECARPEPKGGQRGCAKPTQPACHLTKSPAHRARQEQGHGSCAGGSRQ